MMSVYRPFATALRSCTVRRERRVRLLDELEALRSSEAQVERLRVFRFSGMCFLSNAGGSTPSEQEAATTEITRASTAKTVYLWSRNDVATVLCETSSSSSHEVQHPRSKMLVTPQIIRESAVLFILELAISISPITFVSVHPFSPVLLLFCLVGFPGGRVGGGGGAMAAVPKRSAFHGGSRGASMAANQPGGVVSLQVRMSYSKSEEAVKLSAMKRMRIGLLHASNKRTDCSSSILLAYGR